MKQIHRTVSLAVVLLALLPLVVEADGRGNPQRNEFTLEGVALSMTRTQVRQILGVPHSQIEDQKTQVWSWKSHRVQFLKGQVARIEGASLRWKGRLLQEPARELGPPTHNHLFRARNVSMPCWDYQDFLIETLYDDIVEEQVFFLTRGDCPNAHFGGACCGTF